MIFKTNFDIFSLMFIGLFLLKISNLLCLLLNWTIYQEQKPEMNKWVYQMSIKIISIIFGFVMLVNI